MTGVAHRSGLARRCIAAVAAAGAIGLSLSLPAAVRLTTVDAQSGPSLFVAPALTEVQTGDSFTVSVAAEGVVDLMAFQFTLRYDPGMLRFQSAAVAPFLGSTGRRVQPLGPVTDTGAVSFGATSFPGGPGPSGGGALAYVGFSAEAPGTSPLDLDRVLLSDTLNHPITVTSVASGSVTASGAPASWPRAYLPYSERP